MPVAPVEMKQVDEVTYNMSIATRITGKDRVLIALIVLLVDGNENRKKKGRTKGS